MAILGRGIYGLPLDTDSLIIGVGGVLEEFPKGNINDVLAVTSMGVMWTPASILSSGGGAVDSVNGQTGNVILELNDLDDVLVTSPSNNDVLTYVGGAWVAAPAPGSTGGEANTGFNTGGGAGVYQTKVGTELRFRSLVAGSGNVTVTQGTDEITIDVPNIGEVNTVSSVGAGTQLFSAKVGTDLRFKTLTAGTNVVLDNTSDPNEIEISVTSSAPVDSVNGQTGAVSLDIADLTDVDFSGSGTPQMGEVLTFNGTSWETQPLPAGSGEVNTASNLGGGAGVFAQKTGVDLEFRSLVGAGGISVTQSGTEITIDGTSINGTVTSVALSDSTSDFTISGSPVTTSGTINIGLAATGVSPGTYTNANITVDSKGRISFASNGSAGGSLAINDLTDVNTAGVTNGQVLIYNQGSTSWVPATVLTGSSSINDLADVDTTGAVTGSVLKWNGSAWVVGTDDTGAGSTPNLWETIAADTGSTTANTATDTLTVAGGTDISTEISGDTLTVNFTNDTGYITEVVEDATPQLGGDLDVNGNSIVSASNGDINISPDGTGNTVVGGVTYTQVATQAIADNTTTTVFVSYAVAQAQALFIDYTLSRAGNGFRTGTLYVIQDGSTVSVSDVGSEIGNTGVTFDAVINGTDIDVRYTSSSTGNTGSMKYHARYWA